MKINSRYAIVLSAFLILAIAVSSVSAVEELVSNDFNNESFAIDIPSGSDFNKEATTNLKAGDVAMNMSVYSNGGDNANDVSTIMYLKDSSSKQNIIDDVINDLRKDGAIVEENDKFFVVETKNSGDWDLFNFDIGNDLDTFFGMVDGFFSGDSNIDVSTNDTNVQVSSGDGIKIVDNENSTVTLSNNGFQVNDANGENVSISTDGIKVSGGDGENATSVDTDVSVDDMAFNFGNDDYAVCIKNPDDGQIIVISGNNLDLLKSMAQSASFEE